MIGRVGGLVGTIGAALASAALAAGQAEARSFNYSVTGGVGATWHSDGRACARYGLCGVQGAFTLNSSEVQGGQQVIGPAGSLQLLLFEESAQSRVRQQLPRSAALLCDDADQPVGGDNIVVQVSRRGGKYAARLEGGVSSGRCEGPTEANFDAVRLPVRDEAWGLDLVGQTRFRAGPFDVDLTSTLRVRRARAQTQSVVEVGPSGSEHRPPPRVEFVQYRYRLVSARGNIIVTFGGDSAPACVPIGACDTYGRLTYSVSMTDGTLLVFYSREAHHLVSAPGALRDLRRGRLGLPFYLADDYSRSRVVGSVSTPGDEHCSASMTSPPGVISEGPLATPFSLDLGSSPYDEGPSEADPLRTWCPGPSVFDLPGGRLAGGRFPHRPDGVRRFTVSVLAGRAFGASSDGYRGRVRGALRFTFELERVQAGTESEEKVPF
jgi:hypothetical protein